MSMRPLKLLLVSAFVLAIVSGCTRGGQPPDSSPGQSPSPTETRQPEPTVDAGDQDVPDVRRLRFTEARRALTAVGLRARRVDISGTACRPRGLVLDQEPHPGRTVSTGTRVTVLVNQGGSGLGECGLDLPAAVDPLDRVARVFLRFARNGGVPPIDTPIDLYLGGRLIKTIDASRSTHPRAWRICPPEDLYAGRVCPFSAIDVLHDRIGPISITSQPPRHACLHQGSAPGADTSNAVTLTPDEQLTCVDYVAVQLLVNEVGQVTGVNLVLTEP